MKTLLVLVSCLFAVCSARATYHEFKFDDDSEGVAIPAVYEPAHDESKPWRKAPEFVVGMSDEAQDEFKTVKYDRDITKAEKTEKLKAWAEKYEKKEEMAKFLADKEAECAKKRASRKQNYKRLGELIGSADVILENKDATWTSVKKELADLVKDESKELSAAFAAFYPFVRHEEDSEESDAETSRPHHHHSHHRAHNHRLQRNIGEGAQPDFQLRIGQGITVDSIMSDDAHQKPHHHHHHQKNKDYDPYGNKNRHHRF